MKKTPMVFMILLLLSGCVKAPVLSPMESVSPSANARAAQYAPHAPDGSIAPDSGGTVETGAALAERMASQFFTMVSGRYVRNCAEGDTEYTEMFLLDKTSFVRAASDDTEEEVFVYDYAADRFTYLYYFEGELLSKVVYDFGTGTVLEDADGLAELVTGDAEALKNYFYGLLTMADIDVSELK